MDWIEVAALFDVVHKASGTGHKIGTWFATRALEELSRLKEVIEATPEAAPQEEEEEESV